MVVGAFPIAKLGALLLRQVSKPIATFAKERAKTNPFFRTYVCMPPAQFYNWCEVQMKMWILNLGKPVNIPVLNEAMAIELGANLLGEAIIFVVAAGILVAEYSRQSRKEAAKEQARIDELSSLTNTIRELYFQTEKQDAQIRELLRIVADLDSRVVQKPWIPKKEPIKIDEPPPPPSPPSFILSQDNKPLTVKELETAVKPSGLLLRAVQYLQEDLQDTKSLQNDESFLTQALDYIQHEVYNYRTVFYH